MRSMHLGRGTCVSLMSNGFLETSVFLLEGYRDINESLGHEYKLCLCTCVWPAATKCEYSTE